MQNAPQRSQFWFHQPVRLCRKALRIVASSIARHGAAALDGLLSSRLPVDFGALTKGQFFLRFRLNLFVGSDTNQQRTNLCPPYPPSPSPKGRARREPQQSLGLSFFPVSICRRVSRGKSCCARTPFGQSGDELRSLFNSGWGPPRSVPRPAPLGDCDFISTRKDVP